MKIVEILDQIENAFPTCHTIAFADLSTKMVLCTSSSTDVRQEDLDQLCTTMTTALDGKIASLASAEPTVEAMVFGTENVTVYLRDGDELADGLCCVCSTDVDFGALMLSAREALSQIAAQP